MGYWPVATILYGIKLGKDESLPEDYDEREDLLEKYQLEIGQIGDSRSETFVVSVGRHSVRDSISPVEINLSLTPEQMEETQKVIDQFCDEMGFPKRKLAWWMSSQVV